MCSWLHIPIVLIRTTLPSAAWLHDSILFILHRLTVGSKLLGTSKFQELLESENLLAVNRQGLPIWNGNLSGRCVSHFKNL
jgi:hypothetical protein